MKVNHSFVTKLSVLDVYMWFPVDPYSHLGVEYVEPDSRPSVFGVLNNELVFSANYFLCPIQFNSTLPSKPVFDIGHLV